MSNDDDDYSLPKSEQQTPPIPVVEEGVDQTEGVLGTTVDICEAEIPATIMPYYDEVLPSPVVAATVTSDGSLLRQFGWAVFVIIGFIGSLSLLLAAAQTASFVSTVGMMPLVIRIPCYLALAFLWLAIFYAVASAARVLLRLRQSPKVSMAVVAQIMGGKAEFSATDLRNVRKSIKRFLDEYPQNASHKAWLQQLGMPATKQLQTGQDFCYHLAYLKNDTSTDTKAWLEKVNIHVMSPLNDAADTCISQNARYVAFKTAVAPRGIFDTLIVLYYSWTTLRSLCQIYNLRPSQLEICVIMAIAGFNSIVADKEDETAGILESYISTVLQSFIWNTAAKILSVASARSAEGTLNGLMLYRFGQYIKKRVRPIA
ncbi:MAG: DUF697 domain-containing protein [Pirellulaceae bacterium]|nr:DUF697 domain-containing protein [Pirellulaceae bacterium]